MRDPLPTESLYLHAQQRNQETSLFAESHFLFLCTCIVRMRIRGGALASGWGSCAMQNGKTSETGVKTFLYKM